MTPYVFVGLINYDQTSKNMRLTPLVILAANIFGIKEKQVMLKKRTRIFVQARTAIASILRLKYNVTLADIGRTMGKDHTTVIHMLKNHHHDIEWDELYRKRYLQIEKLHTC